MSHTEIELKAVVDAWDACRARLERSGAQLVFAGRLEDRRFDTPEGALAARDHVLRVRVYRDASGERAELAWKGPTRRVAGFKEREEQQTAVGESEVVMTMLERLGYVVTHAIDRDIVQYELADAVVRLERYPCMDDLVEVEGSREAIERAIALMEIPRDAFSSDRLLDFALRFEQRTGRRAVLADARALATRAAPAAGTDDG
ncbi:MAG TPA: class IV adenylate cyclase [Gemmatimonadaceae bacterium]|nr:class IV adenylate cyclase [Gemmatimonadaceae bacterium]